MFKLRQFLSLNCEVRLKSVHGLGSLVRHQTSCINPDRQAANVCNNCKLLTGYPREDRISLTFRLLVFLLSVAV